MCCRKKYGISIKVFKNKAKCEERENSKCHGTKERGCRRLKAPCAMPCLVRPGAPANHRRHAPIQAQKSGRNCRTWVVPRKIAFRPMRTRGVFYRFRRILRKLLDICKIRNKIGLITIGKMQKQSKKCVRIITNVILMELIQ